MGSPTAMPKDTTSSNYLDRGSSSILGLRRQGVRRALDGFAELEQDGTDLLDRPIQARVECEVRTRKRRVDASDHRPAAVGQHHADGSAVGGVGDPPSVLTGEHRAEVGRQGGRRRPEHRGELGRRSRPGLEHQAVDRVFGRPDARSLEGAIEVGAQALVDREDIERERDPSFRAAWLRSVGKRCRRRDRRRVSRSRSGIREVYDRRAVLRRLEETVARLDLEGRRSAADWTADVAAEAEITNDRT